MDELDRALEDVKSIRETRSRLRVMKDMIVAASGQGFVPESAATNSSDIDIGFTGRDSTDTE